MMAKVLRYLDLVRAAGGTVRVVPHRHLRRGEVPSGWCIARRSLDPVFEIVD